MNPPALTKRTPLSVSRPTCPGRDRLPRFARIFSIGGAAAALTGVLLAPTSADAQWEYRETVPDPELRGESFMLAQVGESIPDSLTDTRVDSYAPAGAGPAPMPGDAALDLDGLDYYADASGMVPSADRFDQANYYFPTRMEVDQALRETGRPRLRPRDAEQMAVFGQWDAGTGPDQDGFYQRNRRMFTPINRTLQFLSPETISLVEAEPLGRGGLSFNTVGPFTRAFDPNAAHVKAGPLYFDLLSIQAGALWSELNGDRTFLAGEEPGWLFYIGLTGRLAVRLTDQFFITAVADLYYLPRSNEVGVGLGRLGLGQQTFLRLNYIFYPGQWEMLAYAEAGVLTRWGDVLSPLRDDAYERRGRYSFGRIDDRREKSYDFSGDDIYPYAEGGLLGNRAFGTDWRLFTGIRHREIWQSFDFNDNRSVSEAFARTVYQSAVWPISPYAEYRILSPDRLDSFRHRAQVGATSRLTQYLTADAGVGYFWTTGQGTDDRSDFTWFAGLQHDLTERTFHSIRVEQDYQLNDLSNEYFGTQATYAINHRFTNYLGARAFANYFYGDDLTTGERDIESWRFGVRTTASLYWGTDLSLLGFYDETIRKGAGGIRSESLILRATLGKELLPRLYGEVGYQFEDFESGPTGFDEHLLFMNLTRYF